MYKAYNLKRLKDQNGILQFTMFKYTKKNHHPYCILHFKKSLVLIYKTFVNTIGETHLNTISRKTENPEVQCCEKNGGFRGRTSRNVAHENN